MVEIRTFGDGSYYFLQCYGYYFIKQILNIIPFAQVILSVQCIVMFISCFVSLFNCAENCCSCSYCGGYCELDVFDDYLNTNPMFNLVVSYVNSPHLNSTSWKYPESGQEHLFHIQGWISQLDLTTASLFTYILYNYIQVKSVKG